MPTLEYEDEVEELCGVIKEILEEDWQKVFDCVKWTKLIQMLMETGKD
jgi:hypothetical protein